MAAITVVGDALLDVHVIPSRPPRAGGDVPAEIRLEPGGQGANVAVRLARQGHRTRLVCALGTDTAADILRDRLAGDGVERFEVGASRTGAVVVLLDADRERTMFSQRVPFARHVPAIVPAEAGWLVVSGYLLLEAHADLARLAVTRHRALLGCSLEPSEVASWIDRARSLAAHIVVLNLHEARTLWGADDEPAALSAQLAMLLDATIVVTHADGATAARDEEVIDVAGRTDEAVVDATGAGDALAAGLIGTLADGAWPPGRADFERAMTVAVELASAVSRVSGAQAWVGGEAHS